MDVKWEGEGKQESARICLQFRRRGVPQEKLGPSVTEPNPHPAQALEKRSRDPGRGPNRCRPHANKPAVSKWLVSTPTSRARAAFLAAKLTLCHPWPGLKKTHRGFCLHKVTTDKLRLTGWLCPPLLHSYADILTPRVMV